jgi:hypothetical protein
MEVEEDYMWMHYTPELFEHEEEEWVTEMENEMNDDDMQFYCRCAFGPQVEGVCPATYTCADNTQVWSSKMSACVVPSTTTGCLHENLEGHCLELVAGHLIGNNGEPTNAPREFCS